MEKIRRFIHDNWLFVLLFVPFFFICINNRNPNNDIWFLLNNGRYVIQHGIPYVEPFTIHEGLSYVMQQWGSSVIFWSIFNFFGKKGLIVLVYCFSFLFMFVFYKLCHLVSNKKDLSIILTSIVFLFVSPYLVLRPQLFSYIILFLEIYIIELYIKKKNNKLLFILPVLSLLLINLHAASWYYQFVFLLPIVLNCIPIKKYRIDKYNCKPILIAAIFMFLLGFINPYGIGSITYIFKSYGITEINSSIGEMKPVVWYYYEGKSLFASIILLYFLIYTRRKFKLDVRHTLFIAGLTLMAFMHLKCYPLYILMFAYCISYGFKKDKIKLEFNNKYFIALFNGLKIGTVVSLIVTFVLTINYSYNNFVFSSEQEVDDTIEYVVNNYNKDDVRLFVDFNLGGLAEFHGLKTYIDARAEIFVKKLNGKKDIFKESKALNERGCDYDKFLNTYNFTHLLIYYDSFFFDYLINDDKYEIVYGSDLEDMDGNSYIYVFALKDMEVEDEEVK